MSFLNYFPLKDKSKSDIWGEFNKDLLHMISFCEGDTEDKYCGDCKSCRVMKKAMGGKEFFKLCYGKKAYLDAVKLLENKQMI